MAIENKSILFRLYIAMYRKLVEKYRIVVITPVTT